MRAGKYVVLFFYPLDFTFVCPTEITAFSDRHNEFKEMNTEILGVSVDSQFTHLAWIQTDRKVRIKDIWMTLQGTLEGGFLAGPWKVLSTDAALTTEFLSMSSAGGWPGRPGLPSGR